MSSRAVKYFAMNFIILGAFERTGIICTDYTGLLITLYYIII